MRPVSKGGNFHYTDGQPYPEARLGLVARLGEYCSYCERKLNHHIHVEHIQPKKHNPTLETVWANFLLCCSNCNPHKSDTNICPSTWLIPDRDNTFYALTYFEDGRVGVNQGLANQLLAQQTIDIVNLDAEVATVQDANKKEVAIDRRRQRMQAWLLAQRWRDKWAASSATLAPIIKEAITDVARESGFFSIWMNVFEGIPVIRSALIDVFAGTVASGCFNTNSDPVIPSPNVDNLVHGSKA